MTPRMPLPAPARAALLGVAGLAALAPSALGHGGVTLAEGSQGGVRVLLQATEATTATGKPGADISAVLSGPGTGPGADVEFWVRPDGGKAFEVDPERDDAGVHHATVATAGRGDWRAWDVAALIELDGGKTIRVTNASSNPPGPDPEADDADDADDAAAAPTTNGADAPPASTPVADADPAETASSDVADISGEEDEAPAWALPSLAAIFALGIGFLLWRRRAGGGHAG